MTIRGGIHQFAKSIIPNPVWRRMSAVRNSRRLYNYYFKRQIDTIFPIVLATGETHNFTYDLTDRNLLYLAETIACITKHPPNEIAAYIEEGITDQEIYTRAAKATPNPRLNSRSPFARRLGWYAIARAIKPKVIVETGVDRGQGALILCAALLRNAAEGKAGCYYGTDINPEAGWLLTGKYAEVGTILYGDSIASLKKLSKNIDLFINDSDHAAEYEYREYQTVRTHLTPGAIILADNAHATDKLALFSRENGRQFLFFREEPKDHWYPGAGIGFSFPHH